MEEREGGKEGEVRLTHNVEAELSMVLCWCDGGIIDTTGRVSLTQACKTRFLTAERTYTTRKRMKVTISGDFRSLKRVAYNLITTGQCLHGERRPRGVHT